MNPNDVSGQVIDAAIRVHSTLGPGLLESAYEGCLAFELTSRGIQVQRQLALPVMYRDHRIDVGYRLDLLVSDLVIVEIKAVERSKNRPQSPLYGRQIRSKALPAPRALLPETPREKQSLQRRPHRRRSQTPHPTQHPPQKPQNSNPGRNARNLTSDTVALR